MAEEVADITIKRHDTDEPLKVVLKRKNPLTGEWEPIDLAGVVKVLFILKPRRGGAPLEKACTGWGGANIKASTGPTAGQLEYSWRQTDLSPATAPEMYDMEWEIERPETAAGKRFQTIPNGKYRTLRVEADLGGA